MSSDPSARFRVEPVTRRNVDDLDRLFATGDPRTCQCAFVRLSNREFEHLDVADRRAHHRAAVAAAEDDGRAAGLIGYLGDEPVGWVSFDRREAFERLTSSVLGPVDDRPVWSVVCFVVAARARRQGVAGRMLAATLDYARDHGVRLLESYPVDADPGAKRSSASLWRGTVPMFETAGFRTITVRRQRPGGPGRPIMRRTLRPRSS